MLTVMTVYAHVSLPCYFLTQHKSYVFSYTQFTDVCTSGYYTGAVPIVRAGQASVGCMLMPTPTRLKAR